MSTKESNLEGVVMQSRSAHRGAAIARPPFIKVFLLETAFLLLLAIAVLLVWGAEASFSMLLGGLTAIIPQLYFTYQAFRFSGAKVARQVSQAFYRGEAGKFSLNFLMFAAIFMLVEEMNVFALFAGFTFLLIGNWVGAAAMLSQRSK
jgi:ATP synthase protein I